MADRLNIGRIGWVDITVADADGLRDFYSNVVGWKPEDVDMGGYSDYNMMMPVSGIPAAGICHARGSNADLPSQWLVYIVVANVDTSASACVERGGELLVEPRSLAGGRFCVIRDPAGAVAALYPAP